MFVDTGCLAPELLELWTNNAARILGKPHLPFRMRGKAGEQQRKARATQMMEEAAEDDWEEDLGDAEAMTAELFVERRRRKHCRRVPGWDRASRRLGTR